MAAQTECQMEQQLEPAELWLAGHLYWRSRFVTLNDMPCIDSMPSRITLDEQHSSSSARKHVNQSMRSRSSSVSCAPYTTGTQGRCRHCRSITPKAQWYAIRLLLAHSLPQQHALHASDRWVFRKPGCSGSSLVPLAARTSRLASKRGIHHACIQLTKHRLFASARATH